jgi:hypothetical protein
MTTATTAFIGKVGAEAGLNVVVAREGVMDIDVGVS